MKLKKEEKFNWDGLSLENLKIAQKVIKVTLAFLEFNPVNRIAIYTKIPLQKFTNEQLCLDDIEGVLDKIDDVVVRNGELLHRVRQQKRAEESVGGGLIGIPFDYLPSEESLKNYVFLQISSLDDLQRVRDLVGRKIRKLEEARKQPEKKDKSFEKASIDFNSKAERKAWEKKWDVLQAIWSAYKTLDKPKGIRISNGALLIKGRDEDLIDIILFDLIKRNCFWGYRNDGKDYILIRIDHEALAATYYQVKEIYEKFAEVYQRREEKAEKALEKEKQKYLITRDKQTGDFFYNGKSIKFENKGAIYYLIFECLFMNGDLDGFCSYDKVEEYLIRHGQDKCNKQKQKINRIKNGIENLFRFSNLSECAPDGKEIIKKRRGKGAILYNPTI